MALLAAVSTVASRPALAQSSYMASNSPYRYSGQPSLHFDHDADCAAGLCQTSGLVPSYGRDTYADRSCGCRPGECEGMYGPDGEHEACGAECEPSMALGHVTGSAHRHIAACEDGRCEYVTRMPQADHACSGYGCHNLSHQEIATDGLRPTYRIGSVRRRSQSNSAVQPLTTRPTTRDTAVRSFRPAMNGGFQPDESLGQRPRAFHSPRSLHEMQPHRPTNLSEPFGNGSMNESRPW